MSSLIFRIESDQIIIAMDTLASDKEGSPGYFTTKFYQLPHLNMVVCGTGDGNLVANWFTYINTRMVVRGLMNLDWHTPNRLNNLALDKEKTLPVDSTTTVYHFGFPEDGGPACGFAYRSKDKFSGDSFAANGIGIKPPVDVKEPCIFPDNVEKLMLLQREAEGRKLPNERVYIGGEIFVCHMTRERTQIYRAAIFPDREDDLEAMLQKAVQ
jgi:hypothetical protein